MERVKKRAEEGDVYLEGVYGIELAMKSFRPVYLTCLEIENEFGKGRGIEIQVKQHCCDFNATHNLRNRARLWVCCLTPREIEISYDYGNGETIKTTKKAITDIVNWVGNNMSLAPDR